MHNNNDKAHSLRDIAADLNDIYVSLNELCAVLQGGGIITARDVEPTLSDAAPKIRQAVEALNDATGSTRKDAGDPDASQKPYLM
jgi:hypothetical protein